MVEPGDDFDDIADEGPCGPLLPPDDRLWRHPSELGEHHLPITAEALSARRSWMASSPSRAGAWSAGIVGALLATGVVLVGGHLTHLLSPPAPGPSTSATTRTYTSAQVSTTILPTMGVSVSTTTTAMVGVEPGLYKLASRVATAMPVVLDGDASGVGVVVSPKGFVLVPASLVAETDDISVVIDGQQLVATLVGVDPGTGLAVVRVHDPDTLEAARFAPGAQMGYGSFVAVLWVDGNGPHTCWGSVEEADVQLSSGGDSPPLLDSLVALDPLAGVEAGGVVLDGAGRLIGMITSVSGQTMVATPGWLAAIVSQDLITSGRVVHGWLGITGQTTSLSATATAVQVISVAAGGAAARAGVRPGDLIEAVDSKPVRTMSDIVAALYPLPPDEAVVLGVVRRGHVFDAHARLLPAA
ncbi:MAG: S1C family serine protease [Acidimicrobiales bacterium]